jgi:hypothetical protein
MNADECRRQVAIILRWNGSASRLASMGNRGSRAEMSLSGIMSERVLSDAGLFAPLGVDSVDGTVGLFAGGFPG